MSITGLPMPAVEGRPSFCQAPGPAGSRRGNPGGVGRRLQTSEEDEGGLLAGPALRHALAQWDNAS